MKEISELIKIDLDEIIEADFEGFLDMICELAGYPLLMNISYEVEGVDSDGSLQLRVCGEVEEEQWYVESEGKHFGPYSNYDDASCDAGRINGSVFQQHRCSVPSDDPNGLLIPRKIDTNQEFEK